ncbi:MAG TPA: phosphoenolpyruvate--protein phosphotransferase [Steroidobacteraceae bacterium]|nr:phosphoenolpyruvate--protein phosphotransferase [Steroidobacteraceae bacterium]
MIKLLSPLAGYALPLVEVPDPVFAEGLAGDGLAIDPTGELLHAPCAGQVRLLPAGLHALQLLTDGAELLMHVGIDTVRLGGRGFEPLVADGARVRTGDALLRFSLDAIARGARSAVTPLLLSGPAGAAISRRVTGRQLAVGDFLMEVAPAGAGAPQAPATLTAAGSIMAAGPAAAGPGVAAGPAAAATDAQGEPLRRTFIVSFDHGLHARPAAMVAAALRGLAAEVLISAHGRHANARSTVALMSLGARRGQEVQAAARGPDAAAALAALERLMSAAPAAPAARAAPVPQPAAPAQPPTGSVELPRVLRGVVAVRGLAVGVAVPLLQTEQVIGETGAGVETERLRLAAALEAVRARLAARRAAATGARAGILDAHLALLADPELAELASTQLAQGRSAAFSFREAVRTTAAVLASLEEDALLRERAADLRDLERQVTAQLLGGESEAALPEHAIVLAREVLPSQLIGFDPDRLAGLVMAAGGATSHVAILAAAMGVPALVATGDAALAVPAGTPLVLDADAGEALVGPEPAMLAAARARLAERSARAARERARAHESAVTRDAVRIAVFCNAGSAADAAAGVRQGAEGCGLLRTEFLFLDRREPPDEHEQAAAYTAVAAELGGRPLTIRTLDAGGDKPIAYLPMPAEQNPALGLRGLRTSLWRPELLAVQLRAILRTAQAAPCRILLPMVTDPGDVAAVREALAAAGRALGSGPAPALGVMIETPASALLADQLCAQVEFLSVGTNDLSQYTLAMDRQHAELVGRLDGLHPAVLRLIRLAAQAARRHRREIAVCGALASDPLAVPVLVGLGVHELSCVPAIIPRIKALLREVVLTDCEALAAAAMAAADAAQVRALVQHWQSARGLAQEVA